MPFRQRLRPIALPSWQPALFHRPQSSLSSENCLVGLLPWASLFFLTQGSPRQVRGGEVSDGQEAGTETQGRGHPYHRQGEHITWGVFRGRMGRDSASPLGHPRDLGCWGWVGRWRGAICLVISQVRASVSTLLGRKSIATLPQGILCTERRRYPSLGTRLPQSPSFLPQSDVSRPI